MKKFAKTMRTALAYTLAFVMMLGVCSTPIALIAKDFNAGEVFKYVSIGDSMTNGYCFEGYQQGSDSVDFEKGEGVYGYAAYPNLVAKWLEGKYGDVEHTKLAPSAMRAEDLLYLLGGREMPTDGWYSQVENYTNIDDDEQLSKFFVDAITEADLITMCIGNASFGAFLLQNVTDAIGVMGSGSDVNTEATLENALALLDAEQQEVVMEIYNDAAAKLMAYIPADMADTYSVEAVLDILAYTVSGFILNYEASVRRIVELNPDVEIILVGLMNTTYGLTVTVDGIDPIPVGDIMDSAFDTLNAYIAGVPAAVQVSGGYDDAKFYYAEVDEIEFISQMFGALKESKWGVLDGLDGKTVRDRNITAYNTTLREAISGALKKELLPIDLEAVESFEKLGEWKLANMAEHMSAMIYLGIEDALAATCEITTIPVSGLIKIASGDLSSVFSNLNPGTMFDLNNPQLMREMLAEALTANEEVRAMCKIYALFKVGNGMSVHPTPKTHIELADAIINAYEGEWTAAKQTISNIVALVSEYYDDAYAYGYAYALENGYVDEAIAAIDAAIAAINGVDLDAAGLTAELEAKANAELAAVAATLEELKAVLANNQAADIDGLVDSVLALEDDLYTHLNNVEAVLAQAGVDVNNLVIIPALKEAERYIKEEAIPAAKDAAKAAAEQTYAYLTEALENAYADLVEAIKAAADKYLPMADEALYNYFYNNPEEVIEFFKNYGPCIAQAVADNGEIALAILGFIFVNYGEDIATYVFNNSDTILSALVAWSDTYGDRTVQMLQVYAEALGLCDAVRDQIENLEDQLAALEDALEFAAGEVKAEIEAKIAEVKAAIEELEAALQEMICSGLTAVEALKDVVLNLDDAVAALVESLKDVTAQSVIDAVQNIVKAADAIDAYLEEMLGEKYEDLKEELSELGKYVVEQLVDAIVKFFPVADELLYNYFYNNPDEVIAFFETYGPAMLDIAKEYGDEALAVVGYVLYVYGDEIAAYVIENRAEVLAGIEGWVEKYGERTAKMLQVYAEALGLCDAVRDQIEILEDQLAALENALEFAVGEVKAEIEAKIAEVKAAIEELKVALEAIEEAIKSVVSNVNNKIENAIAEIEQAIKDLEAKVEALVEDVKNQVEAALVAAITAGLEELNELIEELTEKITDELMQIVEKLIYDATHGEYVIDNDSFYVGLGDSSAVSQSYVDALAALLKLDYANLAQAGHTTTDTLDVIAQNAALIGKADLVTIGYTANIFTAEVVYTIQNILMGDPVEEYDWEALVTEGGVQYVEKALAEIHAKFVEQGLDIVVSGRNMADALTAAVEAYAYAYVEHLLTYPAIVNAIHEIAPEALVVIVGLHNTVENIVIDIEGTEIALGEYVQYTVDAANVVSLVNAILAENTVFVNTPDVETLKEEKGDSLNYDMISFVFEAILTNGADFATSEAGHAYILDQILNALTIIDNRTGLLGDADSDGDVDSTDAMLVLQYDALLIGEDQLDLSVCDVDGDGDVDSTDAMLILQYDALLIEVFPVEA